MEVQQEYERIKSLFAGIDEKQLSLIDGSIMEMARIRIKLNSLNEIIEESGLVKIHSENPRLQKELPVSKVLTRMQASYMHYVAKLSSILGRNIDDEDDLGVSEYE